MKKETRKETYRLLSAKGNEFQRQIALVNSSIDVRASKGNYELSHR